jgi:hypothetical protein
MGASRGVIAVLGIWQNTQILGKNKGIIWPAGRGAGLGVDVENDDVIALDSIEKAEWVCDDFAKR